ncbi:MAG: alpha/beta fold hydrolase [Halobacteriaceae archaeon]
MSVPDAGVEWRHRYVEANGLTLHVVAAGPEDGDPVLLLHGFPDFWYGWREQFGALADAGFRVWAPDQRGYNLSDRPAPVGAYGLRPLAADAAALAEAMGGEAAVVGHDFGGGVAWWLAATRPELLTRVVAVNSPHPAALVARVARDPRQFLRHWYAWLFQFPRLAERLFRAREFAFGVAALSRTSRPGTFSEADLARYREAWGRSGAVRGMLNWYRAARTDRPESLDRRVSVPASVLWGRDDPVLPAALAEESRAYCDRAHVEYVADARHWPHLERPDAVNGYLRAVL